MTARAATRSARGNENWDSTAGIEGWGVGVTAASAGASFGGMLVGGGANVATSFGLNALMGDPFAGSATQTKTGAIGQRVASVKGGGNGGNAVGQNRGEPAAVRMGGPGGQRPSLFDPEAGALACNAGGDVCIELLRQQREAQWKIAQENIKAVEDAEWELFWAYTGAQAVKLARWAWVGFKAWRAASLAAKAVTTVIEDGKIGYLLGQASGRAHNIDRALQKARQLARIGVHDTVEGRALLQSHLEGVAADASNVVRSFATEYGNYVVKESLFTGPGGILKFESTWEAMQGGGLRLTTVIPFGG